MASIHDVRKQLAPGSVVGKLNSYEASKLSPQEQDLFATWMLDELASEDRWREMFAKSADKLAQLANEALEEYRAGRTQELDPDKL